MPITLDLLNGLLRTKPLNNTSLPPKLREKPIPLSTTMPPDKLLLMLMPPIKLPQMPSSPLLPREIVKMPLPLPEELLLKPMLMNTEPTLNLKPPDILPTKNNLRLNRPLNSLILILKRRDKDKSPKPRPSKINKELSKLNSRKRMLPGEKKLLDSKL